LHNFCFGSSFASWSFIAPTTNRLADSPFFSGLSRVPVSPATVVPDNARSLPEARFGRRKQGKYLSICSRVRPTYRRWKKNLFGRAISAALLAGVIGIPRMDIFGGVAASQSRNRRFCARSARIVPRSRANGTTIAPVPRERTLIRSLYIITASRVLIIKMNAHR